MGILLQLLLLELLEHGVLAQGLLPPGKYGSYSGDELENSCLVIRLHFFVIMLYAMFSSLAAIGLDRVLFVRARCCACMSQTPDQKIGDLCSYHAVTLQRHRPGVGVSGGSRVVSDTQMPSAPLFISSHNGG